ncbi:MAG: hypothetical protein AB7R40_24950 [Nitrospiraceae bacterium]
MAAIATLVDVPVPPDIAHSAYAPSIVGALALTPEHRRVVPDAIASKLAVIGDAGAALKRDLDTLVNFLGATFVFDTFANRDERDVMRDHLARIDPVAYAWYQAHFLRQNKLTEVSLALENLADVVAPILTRAINPLEPETVDVSAIVEDLSEDAFIRWRKLEGAPHIDASRLMGIKIDYLETRLAPTAQDFFDAAIFALNTKRPIATRPDGRVSDTMIEIADTYAFVMAARRQRPRPEDHEPDR